MSEERDPEVEPETGDNPVEAAEREAGQETEGGEAYADTAALEQDLADLIGGRQEEPDPAPEPEAEPATDPNSMEDAMDLAGDAEPTEGPSPAEGGALGDGPAPEDDAIPLDAGEADDADAAPSRDADGVPVVDDVVNPAVAPATGLSDDELQRLADHLAADVESRLDGIVVEAVDHEMERVSTALKNAIHRRLKARLPDIIAEFISESRSGK